MINYFKKKFKLITTPTLPLKSKIHLIDLKEEAKKGNYLLSEPLLNTIQEITATKTSTSGAKASTSGKIVLFLNKRGGSSSLVCRDCGLTIQCPQCDQKMAYHPQTEKLICHLCGTKQEGPEICPVCHSPNLQYLGLGTEKVEREIKKYFPQLNVLRIDQDQPLNKISPDQLDETHIFIGTPKIFPLLSQIKIALLGLVLADIHLNQPDYQSSFHAFQLFQKLLSFQPAQIYLQTYKPQNFILKTLQTQDLTAFYEQELASRKTLNFPPFTRLHTLIYAHPDARQAEKEAEKILHTLEHETPPQTRLDFSPAHPFKFKNQYRYQILARGLKDPQPLAPFSRQKGWKIY